MKVVLTLLLVLIPLLSCSTEEAQPQAEVQEELSTEELLNKAHPEGAYGQAVTAKTKMAVADLLGAPESYTETSFLVEGTVEDVCPMKGCWVDIVDSNGESIRVKVKDDEIVFPLSSKGQAIAVQGRLEKLEMNESQHRKWKAHLAEEKGETFDTLSVSGPLVTWRIRGEGAVIGG